MLVDMTAEFELTKEDLTAFNLYHHVHSPTARQHYLRSWLFPAFVWLLICTAIWYLADQKRGNPLQTFLDLLPLFSGVPVYLAYFPWAYRRKLKKIVDGMVGEGRNRDLFSQHRVTVSPESITNVGKFGQSSTSWPAVERVALHADYAFIYTSALAAIVVPRRAFPTSEAFEQFAKAASGYCGKTVA